MDAQEVEVRLSQAEEALADGRSLGGTGFWPAVAAVRRDRMLATEYAERIAVIDRQAFENGVRVRTALRPGLVALGVGTVVGLALAGSAGGVDGAGEVSLLVVAWLVLNLSTHALSHWLVGRALGIEFTHVFVGNLPDPFPGVKIDYSTYLVAPPRHRAMMHGAGAIVSKIIPFALLGLAAATDASETAIWILLVLGVGSIATDVVGWFVAGDWKKVRRELKAAKVWT